MNISDVIQARREWMEHDARIEDERFKRWLTQQLADVRRRRALPQIRSEHEYLADREQHLLKLIGRMP